MAHGLRFFIIALATFGGAVSEPARAAEDDEKSTVSVPRSLQGQAYKLRLLGRDAALESSAIELPDDRPVEAELLDGQNRIVDRGEVLSGNKLSLYPRNWKLGVHSGLVSPALRSSWQKALLPRLAEETSFEAAYRFSSRWDAWGQWVHRHAQRSLDGNLNLHYEAALVLLGFSREIAPWGNKPSSPWRRVHIALLGAAGYNQAHYELADKYTSIQEKSGTATAAVGVEIRLPVFDKLWINVRDLGRVEKLEVEEIDVQGVVILNSTSAGVNYAF